MKISKRQLRRIIREEKQRLLKENPDILQVPSDPRSLAEDAANEAIKTIQEIMGITTGDNAAMWGSGQEWDQLISILEDYIKFLANQRVLAINLPMIYPDVKNPFTWLGEAQDAQGMSAFFERREKNYQHSGMLEDDF